MNTHLTQHARVRLQQRGIPASVLDCLLNYGHKIHDHHGAEIIYFDHQTRNRLRTTFDRESFKKIESKLNTYAVVGPSGAVLTVGHRTKRINRH